jgi:hypothetical protein
VANYDRTLNINMKARQEFERMWARAFWRKVLKFGQQTDLRSFSDAQHAAAAYERSERGVHLIRVDAITGTVSENANFDDQFNPRRFTLQDRWVRLYIGHMQGAPIPPVEVYLIEGEYFVVDGHHRVSGARSVGQTWIEARIVEVEAAAVRCAADGMCH